MHVYTSVGLSMCSQVYKQMLPFGWNVNSGCKSLCKLGSEAMLRWWASDLHHQNVETAFSSCYECQNCKQLLIWGLLI